MDYVSLTWEELSNFFKSIPKVFKYLSNTWLVYKERFVHAWTSKYLHLRNKATSVVEGAYVSYR
ncbi:hypothetical protein KXD40_008943 [Peronospora effusa]|nr:hypothetical protein KXD40_008943 [Peronospora effusa]